MPSKKGDRDDAAGGGTHGGVAIGRTTGMGAGIAGGGTPGPDETSGGSAKGAGKGGAKKGGAKKGRGGK